ncbi:hypothetical protein ILUMI_10386 [Ignelater luminosus]|uniref:Microsomal glutathione S-transferase 1 n=1 Tax=Ignelater luminosus TaxID=2038154 RepID=A0A8K0GDN8_IGNLU|nr:hypothetical protein ILUMI_10386 [Ignelater luminosus]
MGQTADLLSLNNELFKTYLFYSVVLMVKLILMAPLTGRQRYKNMAFANPEDADTNNVKVKTHDDVERVRRAHLNDLENIPAFIITSFAYILTNPEIEFATLLFKAFTAARFVHTFVYALYVVPQPARALSFFVGLLITLYMAFVSIYHFM